MKPLSQTLLSFHWLEFLGLQTLGQHLLHAAQVLVQLQDIWIRVQVVYGTSVVGLQREHLWGYTVQMSHHGWENSTSSAREPNQILLPIWTQVCNGWRWRISTQNKSIHSWKPQVEHDWVCMVTTQMGDCYVLGWLHMSWDFSRVKLCAEYKSPSDKTTNWGPLSAYNRKKITHACWRSCSPCQNLGDY